jgi:hypothetical protein
MELKRFAHAADQHIGNLLKNQTEMVKAHNALQNDYQEIKKELRIIKEMLNETAGKK